jgi:AmmeMemoRadiSam system protein A
MTLSLGSKEQAMLLNVARQSIQFGFDEQRPLPVDIAHYPETLRPLLATFVTLQQAGHLRGCIGTLEARSPLVQDVADHAFAAAFEDPRFLPLKKEELSELQIHISVLSPATPLQFSSEEDLLAQLRPGIDGLILHLGQRRATFLPAVWTSLPDPYTFLVQLKQKAGLPIDFWSDELQVERYTTASFGDGEHASV